MLKKLLIYLYVTHFFLFLRREKILFSYLIKKVTYILFYIIIYFILKTGLEIFKGKVYFDIVTLDNEFYVIVTFFIGVLSVLHNTVIMAKPMKEYILLPFSYTNIALSIYFINIFSFDYLCFYAFITNIAYLLNIDSLNLILYACTIQVVFLIIRLKFNSSLIFLVFDFFTTSLLILIILKTNLLSCKSYLLLLFLITTSITINLLINKTKRVNL